MPTHPSSSVLVSRHCPLPSLPAGGAQQRKSAGRLLLSIASALLLALSAVPMAACAEDAAAIVKAAIDYWRDTSSYSITEMTIHRPDWERRMTIRVWTRGQKESLVRVVAPPKDVGNATLLVDNDMWSYNPKINRVVKIPPSMMNQSWMGSDFSNNDLAKADDLIEEYDHKLLGTETHQGRRLYVIESIPKESAPVVWGREVVKIRDDWLLIEHEFYDQANVLVKKLTSFEIKPLGGKLIVARQRIRKADKPDEWTELLVREASFGVNVPSSTFTVGNLRNPH